MSRSGLDVTIKKNKKWNFEIPFIKRKKGGIVDSVHMMPPLERIISFDSYTSKKTSQLNRDLIVEAHIGEIIKYVGDNPKRAGMLETPRRMRRSYEELFSGYKVDLDSIVKVFDSEGYDEMVIVKDIDFYSHCEHHGVLFFGKVHIGYIPNKKIIGLSKFGRIVEAYSRRFQVQERLTKQIADFIELKLKPKGVVVVVEGTHMCMVMRGVKKENAKTVTSAVRGVFKNNDHLAKQEFLSLIK